MKYFGKYRSARDLVSAVQRSIENEKFFDPATMKYFGRQKFGAEIMDGRPVFRVQFLSKHQRTVYYEIDEKTLKLGRTINV